MKKFISIILIMFLVASIGFSQNETVDKNVSYTSTYLNFTGASSDTIGVDSTWTYTVYKKSDSRMYPYIYVDLDSISGTPADVYIIRQMKVSVNESYSNIDTVTWSATADTTFTIDDTNARKWLFHRILIKGSTSTFKAGINELDFYFPK